LGNSHLLVKHSISLVNFNGAVLKWTQILPSIFGADILRLRDEITFLEQEQTQILHVDLMDGTYVSNIAFGPNQIAAMKKASTMVFDVHMMLANPERHIDDVIKTGAEMISVHYESTPHVHYILQKLKRPDAKPVWC
jgi:ribulose-5-phosphate 3-epimerase (EC 5.1.3.1)